MTESKDLTTAKLSTWRLWPLFVGGFCGPFLADSLVSWLPEYLATGVAFFLMWVATGIVLAFNPPTRQWSTVRWILAGAVGALIAGALKFVANAS